MDPELARRWINGMITTWDPGKKLFLQSDVDTFLARHQSVSSEIRRGEISLAWDIYERARERTNEQNQFFQTALTERLDLDEDDAVAITAERHPRDADERQRKLKGLLKYQVLSRLIKGQSREEAKQSFYRSRWDYIRNADRFKDDDIFDIGMTQLSKAFDPHCDFYTPNEVDNFNISLSNQMVGIGASLKIVDGYVQVMSTVDGGPAALDGRIQPGDRILAVKSGDSQWQNFDAMMLREIKASSLEPRLL